jgi:hypothetical protein
LVFGFMTFSPKLLLGSRTINVNVYIIEPGKR